MANASYQLITGAGTFYYFADPMQSPFNLSYQVDKASGATTSFTLGYTLEDSNAPFFNAGGAGFAAGWNAVTALGWLADPVNGTAQTASVGSYYSFPIRILRLVVASLSGGDLVWSVLQGTSSR